MANIIHGCNNKCHEHNALLNNSQFLPKNKFQQKRITIDLSKYKKCYTCNIWLSKSGIVDNSSKKSICKCCGNETFTPHYDLKHTQSILGLIYGKKSSTYKMYFLRSILDVIYYNEKKLIGHKWLKIYNDKVFIDFNFLAIRFLKYYMDIELTFGIRHSPKGQSDPIDKNMDVFMINFVKKMNLDKNTQPPKLEKLARPILQKYRDAVIINGIKKQVLNALLSDMPSLYKKEKNGIVMDATTISFLADHVDIIKYVINYELALYFEKNNKPISIKKLQDIEEKRIVVLT